MLIHWLGLTTGDYDIDFVWNSHLASRFDIMRPPKSTEIRTMGMVIPKALYIIFPPPKHSVKGKWCIQGFFYLFSNYMYMQL